jgi:hypothetical protein
MKHMGRWTKAIRYDTLLKDCQKATYLVQGSGSLHTWEKKIRLSKRASTSGAWIEHILTPEA